jgi:hypothetical protein
MPVGGSTVQITLSTFLALLAGRPSVYHAARRWVTAGYPAKRASRQPVLLGVFLR